MLTEFVKDEQNIYGIAMMLLLEVKNNPRYALLSELSYTLDKHSFLNFIGTYGGRTITIPTRSEVNQMLESMIYYQHHYVEKLSYSESKKLVYGNKSVPREYYNKIKSYASKLNDMLSNEDYRLTREHKSVW